MSIYYSAGLDYESRSNALSNWLNNKTQILIATKAAGAGIDKPDVRFVIQVMPLTVLKSTTSRLVELEEMDLLHPVSHFIKLKILVSI